LLKLALVYEEVNDINTADYLDFDSVATATEAQSDESVASNHDTKEIEVNLQDLISDFKDEIEMNIPENEEPAPAQDTHQIAPAVMPETIEQITDIADNNNLIDITQHQVVVDEV